MDAFLPRVANFACAPTTIANEEGIAHKFDYDFELKGNFTFTWMLAVNIKLLSSALE